jgi:phenylacetate-CoA ligase
VIAGTALDHLLGWFHASWHAYRLLFAPAISEPLRMRLGKLRARTVATSARREVPAYRAFVEAHGIRPAMRFEDLPIMDKPSYVHRFPLPSTCRGGVLPMRGGVIDESSGSSGTANNWVRGPAERRATRRQIQYAARATFGDRDFVVLNAFALGPWATGMTVSAALGERYLVKSIGPDVQKLVATLKLLGPSRPYLICGYPPFLRLLCDADLEWSRYELHAVVGGEGMSEPLRTALERCFTRVISSFGASDLEINIAAENDTTIALRRALLANAAFSRDLFGGVEPLPMVFQYDPLDYYLETIDDDLVVTVNRLACVSPRIRYNLRDRARVIERAHVARVAADHGIALPHGLSLPFLFHWGRVDHAVAFYGCKLTPEDLQHALLRIPELDVAEYALHPFEDGDGNKRLELWVELRGGSLDGSLYEAELVRRLAEVNQDFRESIRMVPPARAPRLRLWPAGHSPMSGQDARIKKRYIL